MALYGGFFDAVQDEKTGEYDQEYASGDFTGYFAQFIGSGVCVLDNPDSFKVRFEGGAAVVSVGYLFIQGYWLKNDADYTVEVSGTASQAIVAHLNTGKLMIEIEARSVAQAYSRDGGRDGMGGYSSRRDNRGRYSRDDGRSEMMEHLEMAMDTATDQDREIIKRFMRQLENA